MALAQYKAKRDAKRTPEPFEALAKKGKVRKSTGQLIFVVQKHDASHLHYDFRLELDGVLKSWAVPKGPSLNPHDKRLAVQVEDHPYAYKDFEGTIPEGNYGAGKVIVWDAGTYSTHKWTQDAKSLRKQLAKGHLEIELVGKKLRGMYDLVRMKDGKNWLLIKKKDGEARTRDIRKEKGSVLSHKRLKGAPHGQAKMPHRIKPMLAKVAEAPFNDRDWIFEIKWDGYRAIAEIEKQKERVVLYSRNGMDFTQRYAPITEALKKLGHDAVLDGEVVALDEKGVSHFQLLQEHAEKPARLAYQVFDLLYLDGVDLRDQPLVERKKLLEMLIPKEGILHYSDHIDARGTDFFRQAQRLHLEGIMAKRKDSRYTGARTDSWLKIKTEKRQEVVICGFTAPRHSRQGFGALVLGLYKNGVLTFAGHAGSGFTQKTLRTLHSTLLTLKGPCPFDTVPATNMPTTWLKPQLVCEVKFTEWTKDHVMRHPVFIGLREDKTAAQVIPEKEEPHFTHLDKIYWPKPKLTKGDLIAYYDTMAEVMLPYLRDRPQSLNRHPEGAAKPGFFQKDVTWHLPSFAETHTVFSEAANKDVHYLLCQNKETLLYMANLGCIEVNPWNSRLGSLDKPDYMVIDLDPDGNPFTQVVQVALEAHLLLDSLSLPNYVKTSGKTGLHIYVPLGAKYSYADIRTFCKLLVTIVHRRLPEFTSLERSPAKRRDKIYLDFLQNSEGQTLAAPYSVRPTPEATVSTPLRWEEVTPWLDPRKFTITTIGRRLKKYGDLWAPTLTDHADLKHAMQRLSQSL